MFGSALAMLRALRRTKFPAIASSQCSSSHHGFLSTISGDAVDRIQVSSPHPVFVFVVSNRVKQVDVVERTPSSCQQGSATLGMWKILPVSNVAKWENGLSGWTSVDENCGAKSLKVADFNFPSRDSAISYCSRHNLDIRMIEQKRARRTGSTIMRGSLRQEAKPKNYGDNFSVLRNGTPIWP